MERTTAATGSTIIAVGLILALGGCASYEAAVQPFVEQYARAGCREQVGRNPAECARLSVRMQAIYDQYHNTGGGSGGPFNFIYIMNQK